MRRIAVIAAGVILTATAVQADDSTVSTQTTTPAPVAAAPQAAPVVRQTTTYRPVQRREQSFFGRVMELERRKNAWIRRTFSNDLIRLRGYHAPQESLNQRLSTAIGFRSRSFRFVIVQVHDV